MAAAACSQLARPSGGGASQLAGRGAAAAASLPDWGGGGSPFLAQQGEEKRGGATVFWEEEEGELQGAGVQSREQGIGPLVEAERKSCVGGERRDEIRFAPRALDSYSRSGFTIHIFDIQIVGFANITPI